jgi:hypothetical protein
MVLVVWGGSGGYVLGQLEVQMKSFASRQWLHWVTMHHLCQSNYSQS